MADAGSDISTGENTGSAGNIGMSSATSDNGSFVETGVSQMAARASFLSFFILAGFLGNCMLVATIAQSKRLRASMLNLHIVSMASVNLVDTTLNMPLILGSTITQSWDYGRYICHFNSFFVQMVNIATVLNLCTMSLDRVIAVINPDRYKVRLNHRNTVIMIVSTWIQALVFSVPVVTGTIPSKAFSARYLCSVAENTPLVYVAVTSCFCVLAPVFMIIIFFIIIIRSCVRQKVHDRDTLTQNNYTSNAGAEQRIWVELYAARYVGLLCIMWVFLAGPYATLNYIEQYRNSAETQNMPAYIFFTYPWEVDLAFMWMKLSYVLILPFFTYVLRKEVWQKIKDLMLCRKSNTITDAAPQTSPPSREDLEQAKEMRLVQIQQNSFSPPILFAIADGLHVISDNRIDDTKMESEMLTESTDTMILRARKCDVNASREFLHADEDTSDYDSQCDPFSVSNPISVKDLPQSDSKPNFEATRRPLPKDSVTRVTSGSLDEGVGSQENNSDNRPGNVSENSPVNNSGAVNNSSESWSEPMQKEKGDSGIDSTQNTNEKDRKRRRRRRTKSDEGVTQVEKFESEECNDAVDKGGQQESSLEPNDSGRGTGELKKTKRRRQTESSVLDQVGRHSRQGSCEGLEQVEKTAVECLAESQTPETPELVAKVEPKKKRKRRNKNPLDLNVLGSLPPLSPAQGRVDGVAENDGCKECQVNQAMEESPSLSKRPPPRLKPLDITCKKDLKSQSPVLKRKTNSPISETNDLLFERKLIPNIPRKDRASSPPPRHKQNDTPSDTLPSISVIPGQMKLETDAKEKHKDTRKGSKSNILDSQGASQNAHRAPENEIPVKSYRRSVSENHVRSNSNNDSDTALLGSNTSADFQELKTSAISDATSPDMPDAFPKPKKRKKKRASKSESSQDLLTGNPASVGVLPLK